VRELCNDLRSAVDQLHASAHALKSAREFPADIEPRYCCRREQLSKCASSLSDLKEIGCKSVRLVYISPLSAHKGQ